MNRDQTPTHERRRYERAPFHCRATIATQSDPKPLEAWTIDLSLGGVRMAMERLPQGRQFISILFHVKDPAQRDVTEAADGKIVHTQYETEGYIIAVEFQEPLNSARHPNVIRKLTSR